MDTRRVAFDLGYSFSSASEIVSRSAFACASETPVFQPPESAEAGMVAAVQNTFLFTQLREGNPDLREAREFYPFGQNADDRPAGRRRR